MRKAQQNGNSKPELVFQVMLNKQHTLDLNEDLDVDRAVINDEMVKQPSKFAWYGTLHELAKAKVRDLKHQLDVLESKLDANVRQKARLEDIKITETAVKATVTTTEQHIKAVKQFNEAEEEQGLLNIAKQAFEQRKDMLISISSNMRNELDDDLKILKEKAAKRLREARDD